MTDDTDERLFHRAATALRGSGPAQEDALDEVIAAIRREAGDRPGHAHAVGAVATRRWSTGPRRSRRVTREAMRFVAGLAAGAAFAAGLGLGLFTGWRMRGESYRIAREGEDVTRSGGATSVGRAAAMSALQPVQFMLVAPAATRVALVGEFNDWDQAATPMARAAGGAWHVALPLANGRHLYAFVVDGDSWVADPQAPLAPERWFGTRNSVLLVNGARSQ